MWSSTALRQAFLDFFRERGHTVVSSSPLVPANDPTLLFTNAGMVQFKEVFLGREQRPYTRAASSQRCVRAGGKHNDLENVGYTARHHTFFEMLGNFSFGDYFKREAIGYAWTFLTQVLEIPVERLWVTVYEDDDEAADIWLKELKVAPARFARCGAKDNFWSMGDTGPCGPCSEIFYDHGPTVAGGPPGSADAEGDRYVEIWNLVFMQFDRDADGVLSPLPRPSVDTGMGLERLAAVMQGVHNNFDTDQFIALIHAIVEITGNAHQDKTSHQVIADHIRSGAFLLTDGVMPSNEGRGYVLRRIIRRAVRHGHKLGLREPFFYRLVAPLSQQMGTAYPELAQARERVERVLRHEEERFAETLEQGLRILDQAIMSLASDVLPGKTVFRLYDTYGFPVDLTHDIARERGLRLDMQGFAREMAAQRERARAASQFSTAYPADTAVVDAPTEFTGYHELHDRGTVIALMRGHRSADSLQTGEAGVVVLDRTPFYAESGGQVGDQGVLLNASAEFQVQDTQRQVGEAHLHRGVVKKGVLHLGDPLEARVDAASRAATALNHSATHLVHAALRRVLGDHVIQKGSLVEPERLRFDFSHFEPVSYAQIWTLERLVNAEIRANRAVEINVMPLQQAMESGAMALFGEKYADQVRVLRMGDFSMELCGGTHVERTGDIGLFKIVSETGIAAGVRRIEAITGDVAVQWVQENERRLLEMSSLVRGTREDAVERIRQLVEQSRRTEKDLTQLKGQLASLAGNDLSARALNLAGTKVLAVRVDDTDAKGLREILDQLKNKLGSAAIVLATVQGDSVRLVAGVTKDRTKKIHAGDLVNLVASQVEGKGGGRADMAQAGGKNPARLDAALAAVPDWVRGRLES